jgi:Domain of unknown function (DUF222)
MAVASVSDSFDTVDHMFDTVVRCGDQLAGVIARLDPDMLSGQSAQSWWYALDRIERLAAGGKTLLARRLAAAHSPSRSGQKSAAETMARDAGTSVGAAKDALNISERLSELAKVDAALRRGELSQAQAALISDAAAADPSAQDRLLALASKGSIPELREECGRVKAAADPDPDATYRKLHASRRLRQFTGPDSSWNLIGRGTPEHGAIFNAALNPILEKILRAARRGGRRENPDAYAFDALISLATGDESTADDPPGDNTRLANSENPATATRDPAVDRAAADAEDNGPDLSPVEVTAENSDDEARAVSSSGAGQPPEGTSPARAPRGAVGPRYRALIRVDLEALLRGQVAGGEVCEISGVGPIPARRARELLGDAVLHLVITRGVDVLNVTHLGRGPTAAQRIALAWSAPVCTVEGCYRRRLENDHREPWAKTRHTRLDELDPLCPFHHDLKTYLGWALVAGTGKRPFVPTDDHRHPYNQKVVNDRPVGPNRALGAGAPSAGDRPTDRFGRPPGRDAWSTYAAGGARPRRRGRRTPGPGPQPDLFAEPRPP